MLSRILPTDIYALKDIDLETRENYSWPISDHTYFSLLDKIWAAFEDLYQGIGEDEKDVLLSDTDFISFFGQYLHACAVKEFCKQEDIALSVGHLARQFYQPDWESLSHVYDWEGTSLESYKFQLRRMLKRLNFNNHLPFRFHLKGFVSGTEAWSLGSFGHLKADYIKAHHIYCDHPYIQTLLPRDLTSIRKKSFSQLASGIQSLLEDLMEYCQKYLNTTFNPDPIKDSWLKRLEGLFHIYQAFDHRKIFPKSLLLSEVAKPLHKTFAFAAKKRGTRIIGFHHGNDMGNIWYKKSAYGSYIHCDDYVCPTTRSAELHGRGYHSDQLIDKKRIEFISVNTSHYERLWEKCRSDTFPVELKTIMIMGYPLNPFRYQYVNACFFLFRLDLELRLIRLLKKHGYQVVYKMHPERKREAEGIFDGLVDRIIAEPFEGVYQQADALIFGYIHSSTFGFSLCTNRPIFLFDIQMKDPNENWYKWDPEAYELLSRRCIMIPAYLDEKNRIQFDADFFLEKLSQKQERPDFSYVKKFMFPEHSEKEQPLMHKREFSCA